MRPPLLDVRIGEVHRPAAGRIVHPTVELPRRLHVIQHEAANDLHQQRMATEFLVQIAAHPFGVPGDAGLAQHLLRIARIEAAQQQMPHPRHRLAHAVQQRAWHQP